MTFTITASISSTITTLHSAIDYYRVVQDDQGLPAAFYEAGRGLSLVAQALQTANAQLAICNLADDPQNAMDLLKDCNTKIGISEKIFKTVTQIPENLRFEGYKAVVGQEGNGSTVENLVMGMMSDVCALAEDSAIKVEMEDQVKGLHHAIDKLSNLEPSVPKKKSGDTFTHYGSGDILNAPNGTVNKSKGNGNHFPGATFSGSVSFGNNPT